MWLSIGLRFWRQILILCLSLLLIPFLFFCAILGGIEDQSQNGCGSGSTGVALPLSGNGNFEQAWNFFTKQAGLSPHGAAGILGNLIWESGGALDPTVSQDGGGPGRGIAQWTFSQRWQSLLKYASTEGLDPFSLQAQLSYLYFVEMKSGDYGQYDASFNGLSINDATVYFQNNFEHPNPAKAHTDKREGYANQVFNQFATLNGTSTPATNTTNPTQVTVAPQTCTGTSGTPDGSTAPNQDGSEPWYSNVMNVALQYKGMPYYWGGNTPITSFDCSGLWQYSFKQIGINLPRTAQEQYNFTQRVTQDQLKPGDFVFFQGTYDGPTITHVGIYVGNGYMYDAGDSGIGYHDITKPYYQNHLAGYGRLKQ